MLYHRNKRPHISSCSALVQVNARESILPNLQVTSAHTHTQLNLHVLFFKTKSCFCMCGKLLASALPVCRTIIFLVLFLQRQGGMALVESGDRGNTRCRSRYHCTWLGRRLSFRRAGSGCDTCRVRNRPRAEYHGHLQASACDAFPSARMLHRSRHVVSPLSSAKAGRVLEREALERASR